MTAASPVAPSPAANGERPSGSGPITEAKRLMAIEQRLHPREDALASARDPALGYSQRQCSPARPGHASSQAAHSG